MDSGNSTLQGRYAGQGYPLFWLYIRTSLLTLLTLGIYRFWGKTRIRKYIWSSVKLGDDFMEYTGTGLEKFLGFLVAVVVLAIYLGIVQMILFYFGLNLFVEEPETFEQAMAQVAAMYITIFAVLPLWFFAYYRARRYKLARTRWRGIRFGMDKAAWGYVWRALGHLLITISTLGLLLPRQTFWLEKYITDRSWYGTGQFEQQGKWTGLYPAMKHLFIAFAIGAICSGTAFAADLPVLAIIGGIVAYIWGFCGVVYYRVHSFRYLTHHKVLDQTVRFETEPRTSRIISTVFLGSLGVGVIAGIIFAFVGVLLESGMGAAIMYMFDGTAGIGAYLAIALGVFIYVFALLMIGALSMVLITQPIIHHIVEETNVADTNGLSAIRQREADLGADAEGFADALDVGGAI